MLGDEQPKILTENLFRLVLSGAVIGEFLRQPADLDVDINATPAPDPKLIRARKKLRLFVLDIEREILLTYSEPRVRSAPGRFDQFIPAIGSVHLTGYREVTEAEASSAPGDPLYSDLPKLPDGTEYETGDPNVLTSDERLIRALRYTIADVADHEIERPDRTVLEKSQAASKEVYDLTERPLALYRRLSTFDVRRAHHYL